MIMIMIMIIIIIIIIIIVSLAINRTKPTQNITGCIFVKLENTKVLLPYGVRMISGAIWAVSLLERRVLLSMGDELGSLLGWGIEDDDSGLGRREEMCPAFGKTEEVGSAFGVGDERAWLFVGAIGVGFGSDAVIVLTPSFGLFDVVPISSFRPIDISTTPLITVYVPWPFTPLLSIVKVPEESETILSYHCELEVKLLLLLHRLHRIQLKA